jgi:hypothetical protein
MVTFFLDSKKQLIEEILSQRRLDEEPRDREFGTIAVPSSTSPPLTLPARSRHDRRWTCLHGLSAGTFN